MSTSNYVPEGSFVAMVTPMEAFDAENPEHVRQMEEHYPLSEYAEEDRPDRVIDYDRAAELVEYIADGGVNGVVPAGCTGHGPSLNTSEHVEYVERVAETAREYGLDVIAGDGMNTTAQTKHLASQIDERVNPDAHMLISPYVNKPEQDGMVRHYTAVAERVDAPVIAYTVPSRTGIDIAPETIVELAAHDNIVGIKEASGDMPKIGETLEMLDAYDIDDFAVGSGNDAQNYAIGIQARERGFDTFGISVLGNVDQESLVKQYEAVEDGDYREAWETSRDAQDLVGALFNETNPIPAHEAMRMLDIDVGTPRDPLDQRANTETREALEAAMDEANLLDEPSADQQYPA